MTENQTELLNYLECENSSDCIDAGCVFDSTVGRQICLCASNLKPSDRNGNCNDAEPTTIKECDKDEDCNDAYLQCKMKEDVGKKACFCSNTYRYANEKGECDGGANSKAAVSVFNVTSIVAGKGGSGSPNATKNEPILRVESDISESVTLLQIFVPLAFFVLILFIVLFVIAKRTRVCRKHKVSRKELVIRNSEDVQLLDRMNFVNKNPTYFITKEGGNGKKFHVKEIDADRIKMSDVIGEGAFGHVYKGVYFCPDSDAPVDVAVKILKEGVSNEIRDDFEREVEIISSFDHDNILKLLGVLSKGMEESPYMIFEHMIHGDLSELLRQNDPAMRKPGLDVRLKKTDLIDVAVQIANGMSYLTSQHFVHRDLATRNCLVGEGLTVKISDFGMARDVYTCDYYKIGGSRMLPVRWMSPESVKYGRFTTESDIWAFGVVLWEIYSFGRQPYYGHANEEVVRFLDEGILLQRPEECPSTVYHIMLGCWKSDPKDRHAFTRIHKHLVDYSKELLKSSHMQVTENAIGSDTVNC